MSDNNGKLVVLESLIKLDKILGLYIEHVEENVKELNKASDECMKNIGCNETNIRMAIKELEDALQSINSVLYALDKDVRHGVQDKIQQMEVLIQISDSMKGS